MGDISLRPGDPYTRVLLRQSPWTSNTTGTVDRASRLPTSASAVSSAP